MVTIPRTTPVVREYVLGDDQGLRSFYSLNPWLLSLTPPVWQEVDDQGLRSFYSLNPWLFSLTPPAWQKVAAKVPVVLRPIFAAARHPWSFSPNACRNCRRYSYFRM